MHNDTANKDRATLISERLKRVATMALVTAGSLLIGTSAQASVTQTGSIAERVARVREAIVQKSQEHSQSVSVTPTDTKTLLAQWGNWTNWNNWFNWNDWNNWTNYWGNTWGNY